MLANLINRIKFFIRPPRIGDVYYGDSLLFIIGKPVEYVLHGLKDKNGNTILYPVPGFYCYKITLEAEDKENKYFAFKSEVLCKGLDGLISANEWQKRCQLKKISKKLFRDLFITGFIERSGHEFIF
jgi:hypothetical protein